MPSPPPQTIRLTRSITLPDRLRLARYRRLPELGPRLLFFSGGTALTGLSRLLVEYTYNSIHLVTPFDSGGSSAALRDAFDMLSVGDLRSRILALADRSVIGHPEIYELFAYRLSKTESTEQLQAELASMVSGENTLVAMIPDPMRKIIRNHLRFFADHMPASFDLHGASIGNLILAGGYLMNEQHIDPVIFMFSKLIEARGVVRPTIGDSLHLAAELEDGQTVIGQRLITGKEVAPLDSPVSRAFLSSKPGQVEETVPDARRKIRELIAQAEQICFPVGSFYSSIIANLLPRGITEAIASNPCPKVYVPNMGDDPEELGLPVHRRVQVLLEYLSQHHDLKPDVSQLLNLVVVDSRNGAYRGGLDISQINACGVEVVDCELVTAESAPGIDEERLLEVLLSVT